MSEVVNKSNHAERNHPEPFVSKAVMSSLVHVACAAAGLLATPVSLCAIIDYCGHHL